MPRMSMTKNKPLKHVSIQWSSQFPLTAGQLQRKREEFWDTAPAFEGRIEIWNALKAAADFLERNDYEMAQAILDGADIILPTGESPLPTLSTLSIGFVAQPGSEMTSKEACLLSIVEHQLLFKVIKLSDIKTISTNN
ncbi:hypothetical protein X801_10112 [Opisthorchis viverrini]|uniref:DC-UbP/UBTD2 N-terminal domain-containing protein n=1 Tax=Opisthorchis viverrini TaxID=6198 RepID=A0A1S8WI35_OPIVI|nr:hypothetical protein X801_10112 [Opisthorchis viverrini]